MSNYLFHWPHWVSFYLLPGLILAGFIASVAGEAAKGRKRAVG